MEHGEGVEVRSTLAASGSSDKMRKGWKEGDGIFFSLCERKLLLSLSSHAGPKGPDICPLWIKIYISMWRMEAHVEEVENKRSKGIQRRKKTKVKVLKKTGGE